MHLEASSTDYLSKLHEPKLQLTTLSFVSIYFFIDFLLQPALSHLSCLINCLGKVSPHDQDLTLGPTIAI